MTLTRVIATSLFLLALCSCGAERPSGMPVADGPGGGLRPLPDAQAFRAAPSAGFGSSELELAGPGAAPAPELPTGALLAAGLVALGAVARFRRERKAFEVEP